MKKLLAAVLAGATVATMASFSVFAADIDAGEIYGIKDATGATSLGSSPSVASDSTVYYQLDDIVSGQANNLADKDLFSVKFKKDEGAKYVKKISLVEKEIKSISGRQQYIKLELVEDQTDVDEKIEITVTFTAKSKAAGLDFGTVSDPNVIASGDKITADIKLFIDNSVKDEADQSNTAGDTGYVSKPLKNEENTVEWAGNDGDTIAKLEFSADSDVSKYYPKLSTKWDNAEYAAKFAGQDAYLFSFVGNPTISATSRPLLTIYNPFVDDDDELTVADENIVVYTVDADGNLTDVTALFTIGENDDGDYVLTTKTRTLGTYIIAQAPATETADEAPADGDKDVPNTGR
jgi:hypothetical protein